MTSRQIGAVIKTSNFPGCRRRTSSQIGNVQSTSPIPPQRQMITAGFPYRANWTTSHIVKGIHPRARTFKRKNRRHHARNTQRTGSGKIATTNSLRLLTTVAEQTTYDFQYGTPASFLQCEQFAPCAGHSDTNFTNPGCSSSQSCQRNVPPCGQTATHFSESLLQCS